MTGAGAGRGARAAGVASPAAKGEAVATFGGEAVRVEIGTFEWDWRKCLEMTGTIAFMRLCIYPVELARRLYCAALTDWQWVGLCALFYVSLRLAMACLAWLNTGRITVFGDAYKERATLIAWAVITVASATAGRGEPSAAAQAEFDWPWALLTYGGLAVIVVLLGVKSRPRRHIRHGAQ